MSKPRSNLVVRLISSVILLPMALFPMFRGGWWFWGLLTFFMGVATWEYVRLLRHHGYAVNYIFAILLTEALLIDFFLSLDLTRPALALLLFVSLAWHVLLDRTPTKVENWLLPLAGALYIGWMSGHMLLMRALPGGGYLLFTAFGCTWLADGGAYFVGRAWGTHHMAPQISPKKTWEGYAGGIVTGVVGGAIIAGLGGLGWGHGALLGLLLAAMTPIGDLGISMIKREVGVKDTSNLIPGHGGILDRADSLLLTAIIGYYYFIWVMGIGL
ncbi:MAG: phosphatidate cytidylyltransferase [Anaerolineae bacterium]|nr:phosphatidate cytidylyltransferase [Anaerolineae bacterium]